MVEPETAKGSVEVAELSKLQQTVARRVAESKATVPHLYLQATIEMGHAASEREVTALVIRASALALREHPGVNAAYRDGQVEIYSRVNVGFAVAAQNAFVVPTVFDADRKSPEEIAAETKALAARARDGSITSPEVSGATFTVADLGAEGVSSVLPVINPPQAAILGVGAIEEKPVVRDGEVAAAQLMGATLACDHRILYGAGAAEFLDKIRALLEEPEDLALQ